MSACGSMTTLPSSDYDVDCGLGAGHEGPHRAWHEQEGRRQHYTLEVTWTDHDDVVPLSEERQSVVAAAREAMEAFDLPPRTHGANARFGSAMAQLRRALEDFNRAVR